MLHRLLALARALDAHHLRIGASVVSRLTRLIFSCEISYRATISRDVKFPHHGLGVVIGDGVVVGARSKILQNVTLGGRGSAGVPRIGSDVLIGAGACILGDVTVGDGARIGANAVVLNDVPAGGLALGVPATVRGL
jgi:serine O-acetyltransferase